jgi:HSP20 family protein
MDPFSQSSVMALDIYRHESQWCVDIDMPGIDPSQIDVVVHDGVLSVSAVRRRRHPGLAALKFAEREYGRFSRELVVSDELDLENRQVQYAEGVLTITIPVRQATPPGTQQGLPPG